MNDKGKRKWMNEWLGGEKDKEDRNQPQNASLINLRENANNIAPQNFLPIPQSCLFGDFSSGKAILVLTGKQILMRTYCAVVFRLSSKRWPWTPDVETIYRSLCWVQISCTDEVGTEHRVRGWKCHRALEPFLY